MSRTALQPLAWPTESTDDLIATDIGGERTQELLRTLDDGRIAAEKRCIAVASDVPMASKYRGVAMAFASAQELVKQLWTIAHPGRPTPTAVAVQIKA